MLEALQRDTTCEQCGYDYFYDEGRRCWKCDRDACPHCLDGREPLCPECREHAMEAIEPMLAVLSHLPLDHPEDWCAEYKWDGVRALTHWDGKHLRIDSRNLNDITHRYPELRDFDKLFVNKPLVLDGEIVALDEQGRPSFPELQKRMHVSAGKAELLMKKTPAYFYVFDLLNENGADLTGMPFRERRQRLERLSIDHPHIRISPISNGSAEAMVRSARVNGLEGVVLKRWDSTYQPGRRSPDWKKLKMVKVQEFVIGGWRPSVIGADVVGALLLGVYDESGVLHFVGKTGTGFAQEDHEILVPRLKRIERNSNPFAENGKLDKDVRFIRPLLVAQVEYRRWPRGQQVQQAAYKGLRLDKPAADVRREED